MSVRTPGGFGITQRTGASWLAWLADWCREREIFRHDLNRRNGPDNEALAEAVTTLAGERSPADFLNVHEQETTLPRHVPYLDILGPLAGVVCTTHSLPGSWRTGERLTFWPRERSSPSRLRLCLRYVYC